MFQSWVWISQGNRLETYAEFLCCCLENFFFRKPLYLPLRLLSYWIRQSYSFSSSMYGCESWTVKKAEYQRIDAFELWCWRRLLRVPWIARRSNHSILKDISLEYSLEGLMLKLQCFGHLIQRTDSLEKILMLGKIEGMRRRGWQRLRWLDGITILIDMSLSELQEVVMGKKPGMLQSMGSQRVRHDWGTKLTDWEPN